MIRIQYTVGRSFSIFGKVFTITWTTVRQPYNHVQDDVLNAPRGTIRFAYGTSLMGQFVRTANKPIHAMIETTDGDYLYDAFDTPYRMGTVVTIVNS